MRAVGKTKCALYESVIGQLVLLGLSDEEVKKRADDLVAYFVGKVFEK